MATTWPDDNGIMGMARRRSSVPSDMSYSRLRLQYMQVSHWATIMGWSDSPVTQIQRWLGLERFDVKKRNQQNSHDKYYLMDPITQGWMLFADVHGIVIQWNLHIVASQIYRANDFPFQKSANSVFKNLKFRFRLKNSVSHFFNT